MMSKAQSGVNCLAKSLNQRQLLLSARLVTILLPELPVRSVSCSHTRRSGWQTGCNTTLRVHATGTSGR
jgi:hypothetical protein